MNTNIVQGLLVKSSNGKQGIFVKEIQYVLETHFSRGKLFKICVSRAILSFYIKGYILLSNIIWKIKTSLKICKYYGAEKTHSFV